MRDIHTRLLIGFAHVGLVVGLGELARAADVELADDVADIVVWSWNSNIPNPPQAIRDAAETDSQILLCAFFKWHNLTDWTAHTNLIAQAHLQGQRFGGGLTLGSIYRDENGLDEETFLRFATRDARGKLYPASGGAPWYNGTLSNPDYVDYCLKWALRQVDQGIDNLYVDEHNGNHDRAEGYDDYSIAEFRAFLIDYLRALPDDQARQQVAEWRIPLRDPSVCPGGTLDRFDYRAYLQKHDYVDDPWNWQNPLASMWIWFKVQRDDRVWQSFCERVRRHARRRRQRIWIAAEGLARHVDHQLAPMLDWHLQLDAEGRVDGARSLYAYGRDLVYQSRQLLNQDVPVVARFSHGHNRATWQNASPENRRLWLRVFAPELYAAGAFPVFIVNTWRSDARSNGTWELTQRLMSFFRTHAEIFRTGALRRIDASCIRLSAENVVVVFGEQAERKRRVVQLVNHNFSDGSMQTLHDVELRVPSRKPPRTVRIFSPDRDQPQEARFRHDGSQVVITIPVLEYYNLVQIEYDRRPVDPLHYLDRDHIVRPFARWGLRPPVARFRILDDGGVTDAEWVNGFLEGERRRQLRNPPTFEVDYARDGAFEVHVETCGLHGARLEIHVDGRMKLAASFPEPGAPRHEYAYQVNRTFSVPVRRGPHEISVVSAGKDGLRVARYVFVNAR